MKIRVSRLIFLSPLGERLGEGDFGARAVRRPLSPPLPLAGARSMKFMKGAVNRPA
jgi:hypothetical protein